ncbi:DUF5689 domain-containing protein [Winogradskyella forsetii]|uniref:DUF5689 domain-containing protein n=1 Tax=Winogradskyella forsetii TaxID=2686077 RepID=UPI0015BF68EA|nr:DUF5689 domain-containing protein [Winogradskyella forsetii]
MKTLKINKIILLLIGFVVFNGCVQDDDFSTPNLSFEEPNIPENQIRTIGSLAGDLAQEQSANDDIFEPQPLDYSNESDAVAYVFSDTDFYVTGYVVSSDEGGNYFEEIILQDKPENPTIGIKLLIDVNPLFTKYEVGRKIYVKISGLAVGISNGVLTLGSQAGSGVDKIPSQFENEFIERSNEVANIVPLPLNISDFTVQKTNLMIALNDVQFNRNDVFDEANNFDTYASSAQDQFDGERTLESCESGASVIFSTSTFADFKGLALPKGRGTVNAVLSRNFEGNNYIVAINTPEDIVFGPEENRCDPDFFECTGPSGGGSNIFFENFEGFGTYDSEGWDNINISGTNTDWFISGFQGNNYSRISAFSSGNSDADVWLVTPAIDLGPTEGEELSFDLEAAYDTGTILSVYVSTDYAGDPTTATWEIIDAAIPVGPSGGFGGLQPVGPINISCIEGTAVFGFFYEGSDPSATTRYHLDNVKVTGN